MRTAITSRKKIRLSLGAIAFQRTKKPDYIVHEVHGSRYLPAYNYHNSQRAAVTNVTLLNVPPGAWRTLFSIAMPQFNPNHPNLNSYCLVSREIESGWIAQFRGQAYQSQLIKFVTGGIHSHSAMLKRNSSSVDLLEVVEWVGGRSLPLESCVKRYPGIIDIFSINYQAFPNFNQIKAYKYMRAMTGRKYGYRGALRLLLMRLPLLWRLWPLTADDLHESDSAPFCSHAVCTACRLGGGVDPVPRKADDRVTPQDLTQSLLFNYEFTLTI